MVRLQYGAGVPKALKSSDYLLTPCPLQPRPVVVMCVFVGGALS